MCLKYKEVTEFRKFGVELEVSAERSKSYIGQKLELFECLFGLNKSVKVTPTLKGWAETKSNDYWHVKYDSTCGPKGKGKDHGWEIASYIAFGHEDLLNISKAAGYLGKFLETNQNCGLHIHVDVSDFSQHDMGLLLTHWMRIEKFLFDIADPVRSKSVYCQNMWNRMIEKMNLDSYNSVNRPLDFWKLMQPRDYSSHNNSEKRYSINTVGFAIGQLLTDHSRKTVELRLPECKLNEEHVLGWVTLFLNFVDSCSALKPIYPIADCVYFDELLECLGLKGKNEFFLLGPHLLRTKKWFLKKLIEAKPQNILRQEFLKHMKIAASEHVVFISEI